MPQTSATLKPDRHSCNGKHDPSFRQSPHRHLGDRHLEEFSIVVSRPEFEQARCYYDAGWMKNSLALTAVPIRRRAGILPAYSQALFSPKPVV